MTHHTKLRLEEREFLAEKLAAGWSQARIAKALGRSGSTISDELKRNGPKSCYWPSVAQSLAERRRRSAGRKRRKLERVEVRQFVIDHLRLLWSPDEIGEQSKRRFPGQSQCWLSHQTIYTWIATDDHSRRWRKLLRRTRRRRRCRRSQPNLCRGLAQRPAIINERGRYGDWEGDTIVSRGRRGGALVTLVERRSGLAELIAVRDLKTKTVTRAIYHRLKTYPPEWRQSLTLDNGVEFRGAGWLTERLGLQVFFTDPHSPWQRGSNENFNGLVRQIFPKGTVLSQVSRYKVAKAQHLLNTRPRKRLAYQTPSDIFHQNCCLRIQT
jgi:transposase, IS30 family